MTVDWTTGCYWRPEVEGALLSWSDPFAPNEEPAKEITADWEFPALVLELAGDITPLWQDVAAHLKGTQLSAAAGQVSYPWDGMPVLGPIPECDGLFLNAGHAYDVMVAPAAGRYVSQVITGERPAAENPLSYERLAMQP